MTRYAVLLRGVNVGGHNKVPMGRLRELAVEAGYADVSTYVQSGNLVLTAETAEPAEVERAIAEALQRDLGLAIEVMTRSRDELAAVIGANPFQDYVDEPTSVHVRFLSDHPAAAKATALDREEFVPERFELGDRCLYFYYPGGSGRSKMAAAPWDRRLGVRGTSRNWRTVTTLLDLLDG